MLAAPCGHLASRDLALPWSVESVGPWGVHTMKNDGQRAGRPSGGLRIPGVAFGWRAARVTVLVVMATALLPSPALAVDRQDPRALGSMKTTTDYLVDLVGSEGPDRLFAARVLRSRVKRASTLASGDPDSLTAMEAHADLDELTRELPGRCALAMTQEDVVPACADALARLGATQSVPVLLDVRARATKNRTTKAVDKALVKLGVDPMAAPMPSAGSPPPATAAPTREPAR